MTNIFSKDFKLGIIAGGQLAKMLIQEASKWNLITLVLDKDPQCPAQQIASEYIKGDQKVYDDVINFGKKIDFITYEIENININALKQLQADGVKIVPDPSILETIQNKGKQKQFLHQNHFPTAKFLFFDNKQQILSALEQNQISYPFVQKLLFGGYDGRGVAVIKNKENLELLLEGCSVVEEYINIYKELSVIVSRNKNEQIACFPVVELIFEPNANLVDMLICPAQIEPKYESIAKEIAIEIANKFDYCGIMAVEMFLDINGNIFVNELSPRPHNSGHHTIESTYTSQFEQHLRAILNLPLGSTTQKLSSIMINILGEPNYVGPARYHGITEALAIEGVKIHLYGKNITRPYRKMGHITILAPNVQQAIEKATYIKKIVKVTT